MEVRPNFKAMSTSQKLGYVWDYYRFHILGVILLVITVSSIIQHYATLKTSVLDMVFLNAHDTEEAQKPFEPFLVRNGYDLTNSEVRVTTTISFVLEEDSYQEDFYSVQTLSALFAAGDLDIFAAPHQVYNDFASAGYVSDLRNIFSEDELNELGDMIIYTTLAETGEAFPSGLNLEGNRWLLESGYYDNGCYLAVTTNTDSPKLVKDFLLYILNY